MKKQLRSYIIPINQTKLKLFMSKTMLDHTKAVLKKVSFDVSLFNKELEKACKVLLPYELEELVSWLLNFTKEKPELQHCIIKINN